MGSSLLIFKRPSILSSKLYLLVNSAHAQYSVVLCNTCSLFPISQCHSNWSEAMCKVTVIGDSLMISDVEHFLLYWWLAIFLPYSSPLEPVHPPAAAALPLPKLSLSSVSQWLIQAVSSQFSSSWNYYDRTDQSLLFGKWFGLRLGRLSTTVLFSS